MCVCVFAYRIDLSNNLKLFRHNIIKRGAAVGVPSRWEKEEEDIFSLEMNA